MAYSTHRNTYYESIDIKHVGRGRQGYHPDYPASSDYRPPDRPLLGWHFGDEWSKYRPELHLYPGVTVSARDGIQLCQRGPHSSLTVHDAFSFKHGFRLSRTASWGQITHGRDKFVAEHRKHLVIFDLREMKYGPEVGNREAKYELMRYFNGDPYNAMGDRIETYFQMLADTFVAAP